ncbi:MAG TPA: hypothetical protein VFQ77_20125 [Pseudonocardiaceae bacterium]|jgi:hypothetical protein|nr:hypothetical protein [Pseudonocardiaceae bacterium]
MRRSKRRRSGRLVTRRILYQNYKRPHDRPQELKVDVPPGEMIDTDYATAMVAVRTGMSLDDVKIVKIADPDPPAH